MTSRPSPTVVVLAFMALTVSLTSGAAFAADGDQGEGAQATSTTSTPATTSDASNVSGTASPVAAPALRWPATMSWPLPATATPSVAHPAPADDPPVVIDGGHGFARAVAGLSAGTFVLLQGVDIAQTMRCIGAAACHEANPFLRSLARQPAAFGATKMAIAFVSGYALFHARGHHPKLVTALSVAGISLYATITYRQAQMNRH